MPDETLALRELPRLRESGQVTGLTVNGRPVRRMVPTRDSGLPLYVQEQGSFVGKTHGRLTVKKNGEQLAEARLADVSQLVLMGNVMVSADAIHLLCEADVPVVHLSRGSWFYGVTRGTGLRNAYDRVAQYRAAGDPLRRLTFAKQLVLDKATRTSGRCCGARNGRRGREHDFGAAGFGRPAAADQGVRRRGEAAGPGGGGGGGVLPAVRLDAAAGGL